MLLGIGRPLGDDERGQSGIIGSDKRFFRARQRRRRRRVRAAAREVVAAAVDGR